MHAVVNRYHMGSITCAHIISGRRIKIHIQLQAWEEVTQHSIYSNIQYDKLTCSCTTASTSPESGAAAQATIERMPGGLYGYWVS